LITLQKKQVAVKRNSSIKMLYDVKVELKFKLKGPHSANDKS